jgi:sec-independent protein translocase protein TatC
MFEVPLVVMALTRSGIVTTRQLRANRGYVILAIAIVAAIATRPPDPFTMTIAMGPLILLFEVSILLAAWIERAARRRARAAEAEAAANDEGESDAL